MPALYAVVPAAGHSARMGRPKLALPLGDRTILEHLVLALRSGGADRVLVVIGPHVPELVPLAEAAGADVCQLPEITADMRATVEHGLRWLEERYQPRPADAWLLAPADHPTISPDVVRTLHAAYEARPESPVIVPVSGGRRGHPVLISWGLVPAIRGHPVGEGLNTFLRQHEPTTLEVPVENVGILRDLDTPADYERLRRDWPGHGSDS